MAMRGITLAWRRVAKNDASITDLRDEKGYTRHRTPDSFHGSRGPHLRRATLPRHLPQCHRRHLSDHARWPLPRRQSRLGPHLRLPVAAGIAGPLAGHREPALRPPRTPRGVSRNDGTRWQGLELRVSGLSEGW